MKTVSCLLALLLLAFLALPAHGDDAALAVTREAFEKYQSAKTECDGKREEAYARLRSAESENEKKAAREYLGKVMKKAAELEKGARVKFLDAFGATNWTDWDVERDAALLSTGLDESALAAFAKDPAQSVKAWEHLVAKFPKAESATFTRAVWLPLALASTGDLEKACKRIGELVGEVPEEWKSRVLTALGDARAMGGDLEGALREYTRAMQLNPHDAEAVQRATMLGKAAPELDSRNWLGAEAKKLSELKDQVVILHFWASWSSSCLQAMPALDALYQANAHAGLSVVGVTRWYDHGYLPLDAQDLRDGSMNGTIVEKLEENAFTQHLRDFRDRTRLSYPFAVSTLEEVKSFGVNDLPTTIIVDKQGKVAFIAVGGMREHMLRITAERLLKAK